MKLIVGLGNFGKEYEKTRHNAGFMAIDQFATEQQFPSFKNDPNFKAHITKNQDVILAKPTSFMNNSGEALSAIIKFYKIPLTDLLVIYDDIDLALGNIRFRPSGSPSTHNGMKSIVQHLGTSDFPRLRIGIESRGVTAPQAQDISSFVLSKFSDEELEKLSSSLQKAQKATKAFIENEPFETIMNQLNL